MLARNIGQLGLLATVMITLSACGSSSSDSTTPGTGGGGGTGGSAGSANSCTDCSHPPDPTAGAPAGDGTGQVFAIKTLNIGGDPVNNDADKDLWKSLGYDLDGQKSVANSTNHCKLAGTNTPDHVKIDGNNGIDNSFGENVLPNMPSGAQGGIDDALNSGKFTIIIAVDKLGSKTDYTGLSAALYAGASLTDADGGTTAPKWDGTDTWPVFCELLETCNASGTPAPPGNKSKVQFPNSFVAGGTWVSDTKGQGSIGLALSIAGYSLSLTVHAAVITAKLGTETPVPTSATQGVVAGILKTDEVTGSLQKIAGKLSTSFCSGDQLSSFMDEVTSASDIMVDGTQDPNQTCNGISIGLGFTASAIKLGSALDQQPPSGDPCDAGTD